MAYYTYIIILSKRQNPPFFLPFSKIKKDLVHQLGSIGLSGPKNNNCSNFYPRPSIAVATSSKAATISTNQMAKPTNPILCEDFLHTKNTLSLILLSIKEYNHTLGDILIILPSLAAHRKSMIYECGRILIVFQLQRSRNSSPAKGIN